MKRLVDGLKMRSEYILLLNVGLVYYYLESFEEANFCFRHCLLMNEELSEPNLYLGAIKIR
jgi:hypothetical protein